jgi:hypothetical protein
MGRSEGHDGADASAEGGVEQQAAREQPAHRVAKQSAVPVDGRELPSEPVREDFEGAVSGDERSGDGREGAKRRHWWGRRDDDRTEYGMERYVFETAREMVKRGHHVSALHREAVGPIALDDLAEGAWRVLSAADRARLADALRRGP